MPSRWEPERLVAEIERLAIRGLPRGDFHRELTQRLRRSLSIDGACWHGLDPQTLLMTSANPADLLETGLLAPELELHAAGTVMASEYQREDFNTFAQLAVATPPVGRLSQATGGELDRSPRFRELLTLMGTPHELRLALVSKRHPWGAVALVRRAGTGDFTVAEERLLARLSRPIADGLRASLRADAARRMDDLGPGMVLLDRNDEIQAVTPAANALMEELRGESPGTRPLDQLLPPALTGLAAMARTQGREQPEHVHAGMQVPTPAGWLELHASLPEGADGGSVAIVLQRARPQRTAAVRLLAHGLSEREREVATLVARGLDTAALAAALHLSPLTVQDHLKAIFEKTATRSRRELTALIFHEEYLPQIAAGAPLDADGGFG